MPAKSLITLIVLSCGLSACSMFNKEKEDVAVLSPLPTMTKAAAKPAGTTKMAKCSTDGFCALPMLKKKK